jgi:hypothetical protein
LTIGLEKIQPDFFAENLERGGLFRSRRYLPDGIEDGAVDPFDDGTGAIAEARPGRLSTTDLFYFRLDVLQRADGQLGTLDSVEQILAARVDGDATFSSNNINQFAGAGESRYLINNDRYAVAE